MLRDLGKRMAKEYIFSMAKAPRKTRSIGASLPETRAIHTLVKRHAFPASVKPGFEVNFGEDSTGKKAVWIWFETDDDLKPSPRKISELTDFAKSIRSEIFNSALPYWPYVEFRAKMPAKAAS